ncbi:MAG TPA: hypothetical protein VLM11_06675 [Streptosporangiaceae bacterium]|nr:hypothetical protein [Streptosporangiaceae bacterium]
MSSQSVSSGSKRTLTIVLAIVAVLALVAAILWLAGASPHFLNLGSHVKGSSGHHLFRGIAALVVAIVCGAGAWFTNKK